MDKLSRIAQRLNGKYTKQEYPALAEQIEHWGRTKPFRGIGILDATPIFNNTLLKYSALIAAGADLKVGISDKLPHDPSCIDFLNDIGIATVRDDGTLREFDVIMDCGAVFSHVHSRKGYVELTRSGYYGYENSGKPVFMADSGLIKQIETTLGTGEGYFRAMEQLGYDNCDGRLLVVFGSGKVGRGLILYGLRHGARVVTVTDTATAGDIGCPVVDFRDEDAVNNLIATADFIVSATGIGGALSRFAKALDSSKALIANMGVEDEFGAELPAERVLNDKRPLNFILAEPTHLRYIDATMALDNEGALYLLNGNNGSGIIEPPADMEQKLLRTTVEHGAIADEIGQLFK